MDGSNQAEATTGGGGNECGGGICDDICDGVPFREAYTSMRAHCASEAVSRSCPKLVPVHACENLV